MKRRTGVLSIAGGVLSAFVACSAFANVSGAIWTTLSDGTEVNGNIYDAKEDVYLNGGPGKGAGSNAPGLPDGTYIFMVTNPSGKTLLSGPTGPLPASADCGVLYPGNYLGVSGDTGIGYPACYFNIMATTNGTGMMFTQSSTRLALIRKPTEEI